MKKKWLMMRKRLYNAICAFFATLLCVGCGTTKAVVSQPKDGSYTQITITTNNPITTETNTNPSIVWDKK